MLQLSHLPAINASLNGISLVLLVIGYLLIRRRRIVGHRRCMVSAYCVSILFLGSYLTYRFAVGEKRFTGTGWIRPVYFVVLFSHVILAAMIPFLASWTLYLGLKSRWDKHRRLARITFPIWMYVSVTGVIVYVLLFQIYGPPGLSGPSLR